MPLPILSSDPRARRAALRERETERERGREREGERERERERERACARASERERGSAPLKVAAHRSALDRRDGTRKGYRGYS